MESLLGLVRHNGNAALFEAVEMSLLSTLYGVPLHLHAEGLRGTGKTSIFRAVRRVLPRIRRVKGCLYNCDPAAPHCPQHRALDPEQLGAVGTEWVPMPFLEISHSAKVGTVVGSIDLGRLVHPGEPAAAMLPGTLPQAHRGIVFVDEINRLAETSPELADVLLDAMGTKPGRVQIEETGLAAVELPLSVSVWAASNPDEDPGPLEEIRRQLSDRFDFVIPTARPGEPAVVAQILALFDGTPARAAAAVRTARPASAEAVGLELYRTQLVNRAQALSGVEVPAWLRTQVAELYARFGLESLRAAQAMLWGIRLRAGLEERPAAAWTDLAAVAPLALHHRVDGETLGRLLQHVRSLQARGDRSAAASDEAISAGAPGGTRPGAGLAGQAALPAVVPDPERGGPGGGAPAGRERYGGWPGGAAGAAGASARLTEPNGAVDQGRSTIWDWVRSNLLGRFGDGTPRPPGDGAGPPGMRPVSAGSARSGLRLGSQAGADAPGRPAGGLFQRPGAGSAASGSLRSGSAGGVRGGAGPAGPGAAAGQTGGAAAQTGGAAAQTDSLPGSQGPAGGRPGAAGAGQGVPARLADPTRVPATAPPIAARRLASLPAEDWVRTETELDGGSPRWTGSPS